MTCLLHAKEQMTSCFPRLYVAALSRNLDSIRIKKSQQCEVVEATATRSMSNTVAMTAVESGLLQN